MNALRYGLALLLNCVALFLLLGMIMDGFSLLLAAMMLACLVLAHWIKPPSREDNDGREWLDVLDFVMDWPYRLVAPLLRWLRRDGADLDAD